MQLTPATPACNTGACPQVYFTDRGTVVIQGSGLDAAEAGVPTSEGEVLVEITRELFLAAAAADRGEPA
ncbi:MULTISPECIES: hypothetical protein [unclassified Pseudofrankia]|uniref:hypothetical protein n=1 Tax=unclassified Pseudofrankia TaxID=2994372 RepID=UPI0008D95C88|nr:MULTISPECIES: hypothetical protein [unclassified Pseudofrankia]MDT3441804.1 hypothetical protein [Pseudofrankia sp. BMG5.37]OHV47092.1 hypothetical protein BCD48_20345 [Pseudofrankia sp. BMG5.36]